MSALKVVSVAKSLIGKKLNYDCFEFIQFCYKEGAGIDLPRSFSLVLVTGDSVDPNKIQIADIIVIKSQWDIGIYIGNNQMVLAPKIRGNSATITKMPNKYFEARRVLNK